MTQKIVELCLRHPGEVVVVVACAAVDDATKALAEGDVVEMIRVYQSLKETKT